MIRSTRLCEQPGAGVPYDLAVEFESHTVLLLMRPANAPILPSERLDVLQDEHLARQAELHGQGLLVAAGPLVEQDDERLRGIAVLSVDPAEARRLYDADPLVQAGQLALQFVTWTVPAGNVRFTDVRFPRSMAEALGDSI